MNLSRTVLLREAGFSKLSPMAVQNPGGASAQLHRCEKLELASITTEVPPPSPSQRTGTLAGNITLLSLSIESIQGQLSSMSSPYWAASNRPKLASNRPTTSQLGCSDRRSCTRRRMLGNRQREREAG